MNVHGGTATQVFLYPLGLDWKRVLHKLPVPGRPHVYFIHNSKFDPGLQAVKPRLFPVVRRSMSSLIRTQGIGDMHRMYLGTKRDNLDYRLAYIPGDFDARSEVLFDTAHIKNSTAGGTIWPQKGIHGPRILLDIRDPIDAVD